MNIDIDLFPFIKAIATSEIIAFPIFLLIRYAFKDPAIKQHKQSVVQIKGAFERMVLAFALILGQGSILTLFGALKIATRLDTEKANRISNDYFLLGNLASVLIALIGAYIIYPYFL